MSNLFQKESGILLHPTALPSPWGMGELGPQAFKFVDDLVEMGQSYWQILPLGPLDDSFSPYSLLSTFAGNPLLISIDFLINDGLITEAELKDFPDFGHERIQYNEVAIARQKVLSIVCEHFLQRAKPLIINQFKEFCISQADWLEEYATFCALKKINSGRCWTEWEIHSVPDNKLTFNEKILQFLFFTQWKALKDYCNNRGVKIIGDMPIYVSHDSSDVWANPSLFQLNENGKKTAIAGCPPCKFHQEGQVWGNPLYRWDEHVNTQFSWWINRFKKLFEIVDIVRVDHFIGFSKFWSLSSESTSAMNGKWKSVPGELFFNELLNQLPSSKIIAEDLGDIDNDVINLRDKFKFPGMHVLQFENELLNGKKMLFKSNSITYTGTHDNETIVAWFKSLDENNKQNLFINLGQTEFENPHWKLIELAMSTQSKATIIPVQDLLGLDNENRFNTPGTLSSKNWSWRMKENQITSSTKNMMRTITNKYNRNSHYKILELEIKA